MRSPLPVDNRRFRSCRSHHSHPRSARRSDGGSSDPSSPLSNRSRPLSTCGKNGDSFNGDSDATAGFSVNVNDFWLIDFVFCSKTLTVLIRATLLIQAFYYFGFTLLYFTLPCFIFPVIVQSRNSNDIAMTHPVRHSDDL